MVATLKPPSAKQKTEWLNAYTLRSSEAEILKFVETYPNLDFGLAFAPKLIALYFKDSPLALSVDYDPELSNLDHITT
jgi:hypothetical protein